MLRRGEVGAGEAELKRKKKEKERKLEREREAGFDPCFLNLLLCVNTGNFRGTGATQKGKSERERRRALFIARFLGWKLLKGKNKKNAFRPRGASRATRRTAVDSPLSCGRRRSARRAQRKAARNIRFATTPSSLHRRRRRRPSPPLPPTPSSPPSSPAPAGAAPPSRSTLRRPSPPGPRG